MTAADNRRSAAPKTPVDAPRPATIAPAGLVKLAAANGPPAPIDALLDRLGKLHSSPAVALRVLQLTRDAEYNAGDVVGCLEHDAPLAAAVLRLVNSSYYGLAREISSVQHAVMYLGRHSLRLAVLGFGLVKSLMHGSPAAFHQLYWRRSLTMAAAARKLSRRVAQQELNPDVAFTAGLLADLGMVALVQLETERYLPLCSGADHVAALPAREREAFGFDHAEASQRLLARWGLPAELVDAVAGHHRFPANAPPLAHVLAAANLLAEVLWTPEGPHMKTLTRLLREKFDMQVDELISLALECKQSVAESVELFQVSLDREIDVELVEREARQIHQQAALENALDLDSVEAVMIDAGGAPLCRERAALRPTD